MTKIINKLIAESHQVLAGYIKPRPDTTYLDRDGIINACELHTYLSSLQDEMISRSERKEIIFGGSGNDDAIAAVELAMDLTDQLRRESGSKQLCDTTIYAFALINGNPYQQGQINTLLHFDKHMEIVEAIVYGHMYVDVELEGDMGEGVAVPAEAVLPTGMHNIVFVGQGGGRLQPRFIELGCRYGDFFEVKSGLKAGDRVVNSANFLIDAEAQVQGALKSW